MLQLSNSYVQLPPSLFARVRPTPVREPAMLRVNAQVAHLLRIDPSSFERDGASLTAGNIVPSDADPIALAYAGHQFGSFVPQLGDGRAILLGEVKGSDGTSYDLQWKGPGRTPYSRGGDGRAALSPILRELLVSEAMAAYGIPTTRVLAAARTGEPVFRDRPLEGAVLLRVAKSHLRVGTFQFAAARGEEASLKALTHYALARLCAHDAELEPRLGATTLLDTAILRQAKLIAQWISVGFVHGVMNTDNTAISGETLDYGPCAFIDRYEPLRTFSSIDRGRRYAFMKQPSIALWNLTRLAESLLPLLSPDETEAVALAEASLQRFSGAYQTFFLHAFCNKIGISPEASVAETDLPLIYDLLERMHAQKVDFTNFFRTLASAPIQPNALTSCATLFADPSAFTSWAEDWTARLDRLPGAPAEKSARMKLANPAVIPRNHLVEKAISDIAERNDWKTFDALSSALATPFEDPPEEHAALTQAPGDEQYSHVTFCGT